MWYDQNLVLLTLGGSHAYGLATETSDVDERGVALPPVDWLVGFPPGNERPQTHNPHRLINAKGLPEKRDVVVHTLAKFCRLALNANPNTLELLFCREQDVLLQTEVGEQLRGMRDKFLSLRAYASYSAYAVAQLKRMRNSHPDHGSRPAAITPYGYNPKNAMHVIRVLRMSKTLLETGHLEVYRRDREDLLAIRQGTYPIEYIQTMAETLDAECRLAYEHSSLPAQPDAKGVEQWLIRIQAHWVQGNRSWVQSR